MKMGVTDDWYTDGRVPSLRPSVISSLVKLFNGVVDVCQIMKLEQFLYRRRSRSY